MITWFQSLMMPAVGMAGETSEKIPLRSARLMPKPDWLPDYKPGPYPKTKEEREAAAKKYNLLPEEYEPYEDDGLGSGDYPKLPFETIESKDPYHNWDNPTLRRDFMEPVPREILIMHPLGVATNKRDKYSPPVQLLIYFGYIIGVSTLIWALDHIVIVSPDLEKQLPFTGKTHYTFELDKKTQG